MTTAVRVGVVATEAPESRGAWLSLARTLEASGADTLLIPDHVGGWPPFTPLVAAAQVTEHLRFGVQVLNNEFWNPALLAREATAADVLTGGRLELGLGAGHAQQEFDAVGISYRSPGRRVARLEESVGLVRRLLAGERVTHAGAYDLSDSEIGFATAQEHVPIMIGGNGDRVLALAAAKADIVSLTGFRSGTGQRAETLSHFSWAGLADRLEHVARNSQGRDERPDLSVLIQRVQITDEPEEVAAEMAAGNPAGARVLLDNPFVILGSMDFATQQLRRMRDEFGVTYFTTFAGAASALLETARPLRHPT